MDILDIVVTVFDAGWVQNPFSCDIAVVVTVLERLQLFTMQPFTCANVVTVTEAPCKRAVSLFHRK